MTEKLLCPECDTEFVRTADDGTTTDACPECGAPASDARHQRNTNGRDNAGGKDNANGKDNKDGKGKKELTCDDCGRPVHLPFKPRRNRAVYCKECYQSRSGAENGSGKRKRNGRQHQHQPEPAARVKRFPWEPEGPPPPPPLPRRGFGSAGSYE